MNNNGVKIFDFIAPIYAIFYKFQVKYYNKIILRVKKDLDIREYKSVLDIGCGTGALCYVLYTKGLKPVGVDASEKMVEIAKRKLRDTEIEIYKVNPNIAFPFKDNSFDIVISSYLAHGLKKNDRIKLYKEASRLAKEKIIFHDYNKNRALLTTLIEWLERGDYFNFIKVAEDEMKEYFKDVKIVNVDKRASWYILEPYK